MPNWFLSPLILGALTGKAASTLGPAENKGKPCCFLLPREGRTADIHQGGTPEKKQVNDFSWEATHTSPEETNTLTEEV